MNDLSVGFSLTVIEVIFGFLKRKVIFFRKLLCGRIVSASMKKRMSPFACFAPRFLCNEIFGFEEMIFVLYCFAILRVLSFDFASEIMIS